MKLLKSLFLRAMPLGCSSAAASVTGAGSCMPWLRAIERGTMDSIRARREASPMTPSMSVSSCALMPMWRAMNSDGFSRSPRGRWADISMEGSGQNIRQVARHATHPRFFSVMPGWIGHTGHGPRIKSGVTVQSTCSEVVVAGLVEQGVDLGRLGQLDLEEPALAQRIAG